MPETRQGGVRGILQARFLLVAVWTEWTVDTKSTLPPARRRQLPPDGSAGNPDRNGKSSSRWCFYFEDFNDHFSSAFIPERGLRQTTVSFPLPEVIIERPTPATRVINQRLGSEGMLAWPVSVRIASLPPDRTCEPSPTDRFSGRFTDHSFAAIP